jgi:hypothetical protein
MRTHLTINNNFKLFIKDNKVSRLIVELDYDITPLVRPDAKIGSRRFFGIESLKVV